MEPDITPESEEEVLLPPETDYDRHEYIDDFYGPGLEYDNVFNADGSLSEPLSMFYPCSKEDEPIFIEMERIARLQEINSGGSLMKDMNQNMNNDEKPENSVENASSMDSYFDLDQDGKVSISETLKADAELAETYAESAEKKGGAKGKFAGLFSRLFKAVDKK